MGGGSDTLAKYLICFIKNREIPSINFEQVYNYESEIARFFVYTSANSIIAH